MEPLLYIRSYEGRTFQASLPTRPLGAHGTPAPALDRAERLTALALATGTPRGAETLKLFCSVLGLNWLRLAEQFHVDPERAKAWMRGGEPIPFEVWPRLATAVRARAAEPVDGSQFPEYPFDQIRVVEVMGHQPANDAALGAAPSASSRSRLG